MKQLKYTQIGARKFQFTGNLKFLLGCIITIAAPSAIAAVAVIALSHI